jgi:hypothetical protein
MVRQWPGHAECSLGGQVGPFGFTIGARVTVGGGAVLVRCRLVVGLLFGLVGVGVVVASSAARPRASSW